MLVEGGGKIFFPQVAKIAGNLTWKVGSNMSSTRDSASSGYPNTEKRVENTTRSGVLFRKFEVFE